MQRWLAWNIYFRLHEFAKKHQTFAILREMEAADRLSASELDELQEKKLQEFIRYAYTHVPYVRGVMKEAGIEPSRIRYPEDLRLLPLMSKAEVRNHRQQLRSEIAKDLTSLTTGGSTGEPLIFDIAKRRVASRVACRQRVARWWGVSIGVPEVALWGSPVEVSRQDWIRNLRDRFLSTRLLSAFEMKPATMSRYLDLIERYRCRQIFAYPSAIYLLCQHARREGRDLRRLGIKVVFVTGEVLLPYQREVITETLKCPVADGYGGRDSGFISHECPQGGMHILSDTVVVEILNAQGQPVPAGETGEIVVTDLYSHEAPFLRYRTGDLAVASDRSCACGRSLPLLERIEGRSNDSVVAADGRIINSLALIYPVREVAGIEQYRIRQKALNCFHIQIVRNENFQPDGEDRIRENWTRLLRSQLDITFEYLPALASERSGKLRHVISDVPVGRDCDRERENRAILRS